MRPVHLQIAILRSRMVAHHDKARAVSILVAAGVILAAAVRFVASIVGV